MPQAAGLRLRPGLQLRLRQRPVLLGTRVLRRPRRPPRRHPVDQDTTRLVSQWLVHEDAVEGVDYDVEALKGVFHVTNVEDCDLAELNQRGVNSHRFVPGPNSPTREPFIKAALDKYLALMGDAA
ncbi:MAG: SRPBCC family protein [Solirubrobacterales bacterium]